MKKPTFLKSNFGDLVIISARFLLAFVFLTYGIGKLTGNQFGNLTPEELITPVKDTSLFKLSWLIFENEPFKSFIGISQIIASLLILFRRTAVIGILMLIPIILNILIIDITIMPSSLKISFIFRLSFYLILCGLILLSYKEGLIKAWRVLTTKNTFKKHKFWYYLLIPIIAILLEVLSVGFKLLYLLMTDYESTMESIKSKF